MAPVNQPRLSRFEKCRKTIVGDQISTNRKISKQRTWWSKLTDESACLCTQMSGLNLF